MFNPSYRFYLTWLLFLLARFAMCQDWTNADGYGDASVRYKQVPNGICELDPNVKSFSGYVDISDNEHIFFWFFEARNMDPLKAPLTTWISGGPGDASMSELFTEHGPCRIEPDNKTVHFNPFSWNHYSNVLYIDQPVQVGFSYTDLVPTCLCTNNTNVGGVSIERLDDGDCPCDDSDILIANGNFSNPIISTTADSTENAAPNFWLTLQSFMAAFPQYSGKGVHLSSESYGGHYIPIFSKYILDQNSKNLSGAKCIDIKSILVGNGWFSPQLQYASFYDFGFASGNTYDIPDDDDDDNSKNKTVRQSLYDEDGCLDQLKLCDSEGDNNQCLSADIYCANNVEAGWTNLTGRDNNDIREVSGNGFPDSYYSKYLQDHKVRAAIGALQTYTEYNPVVGAAFLTTGDDARELDIPNILKELVDNGIRVSLYAGDSDYECNWRGVEAVANNVGIQAFNSAGYVDISTPDEIVHGQVKQYGGFSFSRVYQAGHAVGAYQPLLLQTLFARTLQGTDLATGQVAADSSYHTTGQSKSTYMEGNATVQCCELDDNPTYNYTSNAPSYDNFQPTWDPEDP